MRLVIIGCEYSGTTTLATAICKWAEDIMGGKFEFHDHWKFPNIECYPQYSKQYKLNKTDKSHISHFTPKLK